MPDHRYDAGRQTIGSLLSTTSPRLEVPDWQRSYSWGSDEIESFWQDLVAFDLLYPGNNIVGEEYFLGSTVLVTGGATNLVLDGQQRIATATILLSVLRDARKAYVADSATRLQAKYIADFDDATGLTTPVLTLNVYDREFFRAEIQDEAVADTPRPTVTLKSHGLIRKARTYFSERVSLEAAALGNGRPAYDRNLRLSRVLTDHMSVVVVSSTDEDNAAAVFETLNDRGIGLSTPDLLRNLLMRRASTDDAKNRVVAAWQIVLGIGDEANVDEFLRHFWVSTRGDVKSRKLYREIKDTILAEAIDSVQFSLQLAAEAPVYRDIVRAQSNDAELRRSLEGIKALGAKVLYPALLSALAVGGEDVTDQVRSLASALTTLYVRYNVIGGRESTVLETTIYDAASELRNNGNFDAAISSLEALAPSGEEFIRRFRRASVSRITSVRYLLREIEHAKRQTQEVSVDAPDRVHVEHIYPQSPASAKWTNHAQSINRLGNLTLLGRRLNTSIKNSDFATKKVQGYSASDILMTRELLSLDQWDAAAIDTRQRELSDWVFNIWKFPGEIAPVGEISDGPSTEPSVETDIDELPEIPSER